MMASNRMLVFIRREFRENLADLSIEKTFLTRIVGRLTHPLPLTLPSARPSVSLASRPLRSVNPESIRG